jgi:hypothetical protein
MGEDINENLRQGGHSAQTLVLNRAGIEGIYTEALPAEGHNMAASEDSTFI